MSVYHIDPMPLPLSNSARDLLRRCEPATIGHFRETGFVDPEITCRYTAGIVAGTAVTISIPPGDGTLLNHALRFLRCGDVLVIDQQGDRQHACWGGVLTYVACRIGLAGVVIEGMATDIAAIRDSRLPVWSRGLTAMTTKLGNEGGEMNRPVSIGGVVVSPGDAILADENGILALPPGEVEQVTARALALEADEKRILDRLTKGEQLSDISGASQMIAEAIRR